MLIPLRFAGCSICFNQLMPFSSIRMCTTSSTNDLSADTLGHLTSALHQVQVAVMQLRNLRTHRQPAQRRAEEFKRLMADLQEAFRTKFPAALAFAMPGPCRVIEMYKADLTAAREAWIVQAPAGPLRIDRQKGDFLSYRDHHGLVADFYSLRHAHGTAVANAGVPRNTTFRLRCTTRRPRRRSGTSTALRMPSAPHSPLCPTSPRTGNGR